MIVPRDAATIMLVRDEPDGMEVLMLRRNLASSWVGGVHLFPGGAVDETDSGPWTASCSPGRDDRDASRLLDLESGGLGFFVAAIRECFEEAGVLLATQAGRPLDLSAEGLPERLLEARRRLNAGELSFAEFCAAEELELDTGRLCYFSHWITPEGSPRRYDTRFFVALLPEGQTALHDDLEVIESIWVRPSLALELHEKGEIELWLPTIKNLEAISRFNSATALLAAASSLEIQTILPKVTVAEQGVRILLPGDEGYETAISAPGGEGFPPRSPRY